MQRGSQLFSILSEDGRIKTVAIATGNKDVVQVEKCAGDKGL
jgi:hypothetical protein